MKDKEVLKEVLAKGAEVVRINGSHHFVRLNGRTTTIPVHGKEMPKGLYHKILKDLGLK